MIRVLYRIFFYLNIRRGRWQRMWGWCLDSAVTTFLPGLDKQEADSVKLHKARQAVMYRNKPVVRRKAFWSLYPTIYG